MLRGSDKVQANGARDPDAEFDLIQSKLLPPRLRAGVVERESLVKRLLRADAGSIVSVVAPAGYGKSTLVAQWARQDDRPFAWVSVDEYDNDPKVFLTYVARALAEVEPVPQRVFDSLASPGSAVLGTAVLRVGAAFASMRTPSVLVLDDVHLLQNSECRLAVQALADHVPPGSQLVLVGRTAPPLRVPRLRADGRLVEIGRAHLTMSVEEAELLLRRAEVTVDEAQLDDLYVRTEGWPVGLYLAALSLRAGGVPGSSTEQFTGDDLYLSQYVEAEFLSRTSRAERLFLTRAAALDRFSAPLCEAVLDVPGAAASLAVLAESNSLLVPLDHRGQWFRYHHLFRDLLRAELERTEPNLLPTLRRRAAAWHVEHDEPEEAMEYSMLAGDVDTAARLLESLWGPLYRRGRIATLQRWFAWLDERAGIERRAMNAVNAALLGITTGQAAQAERWTTAIDRWQQESAGPRFDGYSAALASIAQAMTCRHGVARMRADADEAASLWEGPAEMPRTIPLLQGVARALAGDSTTADRYFAEAEVGDPGLRSADVYANTLCQRSLLAAARGEWTEAHDFLVRARAELRDAGIEDSFAAAFVAALRSRTLLHGADSAGARRELRTALRLRGLLTYALPYQALQCRLAIGHVELALDDVAGARTILGEIDDILRHRPEMGTLLDEVEELRRHVDAFSEIGVAGVTSLTAAELRVLPLLATHLTYAEIGAELFLSKNTVRTQVSSIFRKLDVASRSEAVARSRQLALLDG
ncbi:LuxR C-terminal-related transcriptional regulator [Leifsonia poae]|uniref:LuxR C-terminal-related transcriptional regulator n=1 Tax=Leifsonia poae TaxID=110933 RepID=UPI003D697F5A